MKNSTKKEASLANFLRTEKIQGGVINGGSFYLNVVLSPEASKPINNEDKLGVVLTFREWLSVRYLIEHVSESHHTLFMNGQLEMFLLEALRSIPSPEASDCLDEVIYLQEDFIKPGK